ncbi:MAG: UDP-N-acetylmuramate dehydrogenase [Candidatus Paceibacterota bacterium]
MKKDILLSEFSNYKIGGPASYFFAAKNDGEIIEAVKWAKDKKLPIFILGGGTNLLISDSGFDGLVLKPDINFLEVSGNKITAGAGVLMADLLKFCIKNNLSGLEWAGGLPGTLGGAVRGNAGAFGGEVKDSIESVKSFNTKDQKIINRKNSGCRFGYRSSIIKEKNGAEIVLSATLKLQKGDSGKIKSAIAEKIDYRKERHPLEYPNIGSIFKNIELKSFSPSLRKNLASMVKTDPIPVVPVAFLISEAGLKGISFGGAMISPKHPNFIVNVLEAKAIDVLSLINLVKLEIKKKYKVDLEEEVQIV